MSKIYVGGVQGVGKGAVIENCQLGGFKVLNFAEAMRQELRKEYNHDEMLTKLSQSKRSELRNTVFEALKTDEDSLIVDGHYALPIKNEDSKILDFEEGIPQEYRSVFDMYVLLEAPPEEILSWRTRDASRIRSVKLLEIRLELEKERAAFNEIIASGFQGSILQNTDIETTSRNLYKLISENKDMDEKATLADAKVKEVTINSIVIKSKLPGTDFVVNPYVGCLHGCIYCYATFMKRFTNHTEKWGTFVDVKINAAERIGNVDRLKGKKILFSSVTDAYNAPEAKYKITRQILEKLSEINPQPKIEILTKSRLVIRDIDIIKRFEDATLGVSMSTLNEKYSKMLEPMASLPRLRLDTLKRCKEAGLKTYIFLSPIFPYITEVEKIMENAVPYVDYFMFENLNVRPANRSNVYNFIRKTRPDLLENYKNIYERKDYSYWNSLEETIKKLGEKYGKETRIFFHHGGFDKQTTEGQQS